MGRRRAPGPPGGRPFPKPPERPPKIIIPPWTPFGPGDNVPLDAPSVVAQAEALRADLIKTRNKLERLRRRGAPPDDREPPRPFTGPRSNLMLPYLLIRTRVGDTGARPIVVPPTTDYYAYYQSPDIILTTPSTTDPPAVGRGDFDTKLRGRIVGVLDQNRSYDVWVHVWNLGYAPAYGVRVRAWRRPSGVAGPGIFIGGRQLDLGDRNSSNSHLVVKLGSWASESGAIVATAECIADTCNGSHDWSQDRHTATRDYFAVRLAPPPVDVAPP